jgi:hypothetical protein
MDDYSTTPNPQRRRKNMSKLVAFAAIQGGYKVVSQAEGDFNNALESYMRGYQNRVSPTPVIICRLSTL